MRQPLAAAAAFIATASWSVAASAHSAGPEGGPLAPLATSSVIGFVSSHALEGMAALAAAGFLLAALRGRKALGATLVALMLWIGFQAAVHSVHHLGQPSAETQCTMASSAAQIPAITADAHASISLLLAHTAFALDLAAAPRPGGLPATHDGRAPPRFTL